MSSCCVDPDDVYDNVKKKINDIFDEWKVAIINHRYITADRLEETLIRYGVSEDFLIEERIMLRDQEFEDYSGNYYY